MTPEIPTILVPTHNRPRELQRLLTFLANCGGRHSVRILDGSTTEIQTINAQNAKEFHFATHEAHAPDSHLGMRCADGLSRVSTQYVVICADDDFVFPDAINECARFLDDHEDHSSVLGNFLSLNYFADKPILRNGVLLEPAFRFIGYTAQEAFIQRALYFFAYTCLGIPPLYYGLRRTSIAREAFEHVTPAMKYSGMELVSNTIALIRGKVAILPLPFGLRDYSCPTIYEPIRQDPTSYLSRADIEFLRPVFVSALQDAEAIDQTIAERDIDLFLTQWQPPDWVSPHLASAPMDRMRKVSVAFQLLASIIRPDGTAKRHGLPPATMRALLTAQRRFMIAPPH